MRGETNGQLMAPLLPISPVLNAASQGGLKSLQGAMTSPSKPAFELRVGAGAGVWLGLQYGECLGLLASSTDFAVIHKPFFASRVALSELRVAAT